MKPSGVCAKALENKGDSLPPAERCTTGCTETGDRLDVLARAVLLVASLPGTDADRAAVLDRVVAAAVPPGEPSAGRMPDVQLITPFGVGSKNNRAGGSEEPTRLPREFAGSREKITFGDS